MQMNLIAVGQRVPAWVQQGYEEFARRLPPECRLQLHEIAAPRRGKSADIGRLIRREGERMLAAVPGGALVIALDEAGKPWSSAQLAERLSGWMHEGRDLAFLIGGPDGLAPGCRERADVAWSLSPLTLPHALVRIVVAEQLYRAWAIGRGHPYHRE